MMKSRLAAAFLAFLITLSVAASLHASDKLTHLKIVIGESPVAERSDGEESATTFRRQGKVLEETLERLQKRLDAADVKHSVLEVSNDGTISLELREKRERSWYLGLIVAPGKFEIRPHRAGDINWTALTSILPEGAELRSGTDTSVAYVWSLDRKALFELAKRVHIPGHAVVIGPDQSGWRTYTMGRPLAGNNDIKDATRQMSNTGIPFVSLRLRSTVAERLAEVDASNVQEMGIVLDGEVLGLVSTQALERSRILLSTPGRIATRDAQLAWVSQVLGRLAAYLPIPIGVLEE